MPAKSVSACPCQAFGLKLTVAARFSSAYTKIETPWFHFLLGTTWLGVPPMRTAVAHGTGLPAGSRAGTQHKEVWGFGVRRRLRAPGDAGFYLSLAKPE